MTPKRVSDEDVDWDAIKMVGEFMKDTTTEQILTQRLIKLIRKELETAKLTLLFYKILKTTPDYIGGTADAFSAHVNKSPQSIRYLVNHTFSRLGMIKVVKRSVGKKKYSLLRPSSSAHHQELWQLVVQAAKDKYTERKVREPNINVVVRNKE